MARHRTSDTDVTDYRARIRYRLSAALGRGRWTRLPATAVEEQEAIVVFGFRDGLIATVTEFWPDTYEPPPGREHLTERW